MGEFIRISRIARPGALYGASVSAQTSETIDDAIVNPIDFDEFVDADSAKVLETNSHPHITGFGEFSRAFPTSANSENSALQYIKVGK